jgi:hypothetical protein
MDVACREARRYARDNHRGSTGHRQPVPRLVPESDSLRVCRARLPIPSSYPPGSMRAGWRYGGLIPLHAKASLQFEGTDDQRLECSVIRTCVAVRRAILVAGTRAAREISAVVRPPAWRGECGL